MIVSQSQYETKQVVLDDMIVTLKWLGQENNPEAFELFSPVAVGEQKRMRAGLVKYINRLKREIREWEKK